MTDNQPQNQKPIEELKNQDTQSTENVLKTIAKVSSWFFAVTIMIRGVTLIGGDATLAGILFTISGLVILPPFVKKYIFPKVGAMVSVVCPILFIVICLLGGQVVLRAPSQIAQLAQEKAQLATKEADKKKADELAVSTKKEEDKQAQIAQENKVNLDQKIENDKIENDKKIKADLEANFCKLSFVEQVKSRLSQTYDLQYYTVEYDPEFKSLTFVRNMDKQSTDNKLALWDEKQRLEILISQATELGFMFFDSGNVTDLYLTYKTDLKDKYGKITNEQAMQVVLPKNVFYKFNWANLDRSKTVYKTLRKEATVAVLPSYGIDENEVKYNYPNFKTQTPDQIKMKKC